MANGPAIEECRKRLENTKVQEFLMGNKAKLVGNPFSSTYLALLQVLQHKTERISKKHNSDPARTPPAKRTAKPQDTARPHSSDSFSTAHSGITAESKDEEFSKSLLNAFIGDVFLFLQHKEQTKLTWPKTPYYVELALRYWIILQH
jgi:hypothetical protein